MTTEQIAAARALVDEYNERVRRHDKLTGACAELRSERAQRTRDIHAATATTITALLDALAAAEARAADLTAKLEAAGSDQQVGAALDALRGYAVEAGLADPGDWRSLPEKDRDHLISAMRQSIRAALKAGGAA